MAKTSTVLPLFVAGNEASIEAAVQEGGALADLTGVAYAYSKDTRKFSYIDVNHVIHWIAGDNEQQVQRVSALPAEPSLNTLYIFNNIVYLWDTELGAYVPTYRNISDQLDALTQTVSTLASTVTDLATEVEARPTRDEVNAALTGAVRDANAYADGLVVPINSAISDLNADVEQLSTDIAGVRTELTNSVAALETSISETETGIRNDMTTMQTQIDTIGDTAEQTEQQVIIVQQEAKDYTDTQTQAVVDYVNNTFELKEV